jgi:hypothetical protein
MGELGFVLAVDFREPNVARRRESVEVRMTLPATELEEEREIYRRYRPT